MLLQDVHVSSLATSSALSGFTVQDAIAPLKIISVLNADEISFILVGAHGLGGWMKKPRATEDTDLVVATRHQKKAIRALLKAFPDLEVDDHPAVTRFPRKNTKKVAIDLIKPNQQLFRDAFKNIKWVETGGERYRIPSLEMALALKFAPMVRLHWRDKDRYQDAHDFMYIIDSNPEIDLEKLAQLGDLVYSNGGKELVEMVGRVRRGEKLLL